jgi:hypothetical protein
MTTAPPKFEVVQGGAEAEASGAAPSRDTGNRNLLAWALGALLVVALLGLDVQRRQAAELEAQTQALQAEVTTLTTELATAQDAIAAHEAHLDRVRESIAGLQELVNQDPVQKAPEGP